MDDADTDGDPDPGPDPDSDPDLADARDDRRVSGCTRCPALVDSRSRIVNGGGPPDADLLFVGEAPGADEDERGEPFVGRSGDVLDEALSAAGLGRGDVRITNCVRCRPPDNRDPRAAELANCRDHLEAEVAAVDPALVVTLGKVPAEHLLDRSVAVTREAGSVVEARLGGAARRLLVSLHPAATLYDRSTRDAFFGAISEAAAVAGVGEGDDGGDGDSAGQSRLGEF